MRGKINRRSRVAQIALAAVALSGLLTTPSRAAGYSIVDLAPAPVGLAGRATSINATRQIAGDLSGGLSLFQQIRWSSTARTYLPTTNGGGLSLSRGDILEPALPIRASINASGQIASILGPPPGPQPVDGGRGAYAAIWNGLVPRELGTLGGRSSSATGITDGGVTVGWSYITNNTATHAWRWEAASTAQPVASMRDLGTLGGANSAALGVNNSKRTIGWSETASGATHAFSNYTRPFRLGSTTYYQLVTTDLGTLGGTNSSALAINDHGVIVGWAQTAGNARTDAYLCQQNAKGPVSYRTSLGQLGGGTTSVACDINNNGIVVGYGVLADGTTRHAFVWQSGVGMRDLNSLIPPNSGWVLAEARSINDAGDIVGWGYRVTEPNVAKELQIHPFWLRPVP